MSLSEKWISSELLCDSGLRYEFAHTELVHEGALARTTQSDLSTVKDLDRSRTEWGSVSDLLGLVIKDLVGVWFYAGWIDQAVLHIGMIVDGGSERVPEILTQFDADEVDQSGDMMVGFLPTDRSFLLAIEVSPDDMAFSVSMRTDSLACIDALRRQLRSSGGSRNAARTEP